MPQRNTISPQVLESDLKDFAVGRMEAEVRAILKQKKSLLSSMFTGLRNVLSFKLFLQPWP